MSLLGLGAGCASAPTTEPASGTTGDLAAGAEQLAGLLERDAACEAIEQARTLATQARDGFAAGDVPEDVVSRFEYVADQVVDDLTCESTVADGGASEGTPGTTVSDVTTVDDGAEPEQASGDEGATG
ncbi:hypothetical protein [Egicoccus halophilus]|uniref:Uncharacterized protein n=1 Tax=Egicoccus halophilus TaxID=1670830 RepID=A0A8J3EYF6_9ACTN|nr:hypothetical protein [Egicoccus halophilus]GGI07784.1 hypothetical protein GCM10011354_25820 [Egicoccus halophilus]